MSNVQAAGENPASLSDEADDNINTDDAVDHSFEPTGHSKSSKRRKNKKKARKPRCYDWVMSNTSTNHVCRDRESFTEYIPFESHLQSQMGGRGNPVAGIGSVTLTLLRSANSTETNTVTLEHVLHIPDIITNIFAVNIEGLTAELGGGKIWDGARANRVEWGYTTPNCVGLPILALAGGLKGGSGFVEGEHYWIRCEWPKGERVRYARFLEENARKYWGHLARVEDRIPDMSNVAMIISASQLAREEGIHIEEG